MVSVIVPNYNHAPYLKRRIDSILSQTYRDIEIIILDDNSNDKSKEVIELYRTHPNVKSILYNESNSGSVFSQWKRGINLAKGEWIWIAESDDYCEPSFLQTLLEDIGNRKEVVLAYCQSIMFTNEGRITGKSFWKEMTSLKNGREWVVEEMLGTCGLCNASMAIFHKNALWNINWEITDFKLCGDWYFWTQIASKGDVLISGKNLNYFRKHLKSASNTPSKKGAYYLEGIKVFEYAKKIFNLSDDEIEIGLARYVKHFYFNVSEIESDEIKRMAWSVIEKIHPTKARYIRKELETANKREKIKRFFKNIVTLKWLHLFHKQLVKAQI